MPLVTGLNMTRVNASCKCNSSLVCLSCFAFYFVFPCFSFNVVLFFCFLLLFFFGGGGGGGGVKGFFLFYFYFIFFRLGWGCNIYSLQKRETMLVDGFSNEPLKICLILFLTNLTKYMAVFHFLKSKSNDVTDVYFN